MSPAFYLWSFPGAPVKAHLSLDVISRLRRDLQMALPGIATQGLLFGRAGEGLTEILDYKHGFSDADSTQGEVYRDGNGLLVGCYRVESGDKLRLSDADVEFAKLALPQRYQVFLLIQPTAFGPPNASFFFNSSDGRMSPFSLTEFPFDASLLAAEEREQARRAQPPMARDSVVEVLPPPPRRWPGLLRFGGYATVALVALGAGIALMPRKFEWTWPTVRTARTEPPASALSALSMDLRASSQNSDVLITWNRESPVVAGALAGTLSVEDGSATRVIPLSASAVHSSSIVYVPQSSHLVVHLAITTPKMSVTESVVVVLPPNQNVPPKGSVDPGETSAVR